MLIKKTCRESEKLREKVSGFELEFCFNRFSVACNGASLHRGLERMVVGILCNGVHSTRPNQ